MTLQSISADSSGLGERYAHAQTPATRIRTDVWQVVERCILEKQVGSCVVGESRESFSMMVTKVVANFLGRDARRPANRTRGRRALDYALEDRACTRLGSPISHHCSPTDVARYVFQSAVKWQFIGEGYLLHLVEGQCRMRESEHEPLQGDSSSSNICSRRQVVPSRKYRIPSIALHLGFKAPVDDCVKPAACRDQGVGIGLKGLGQQRNRNAHKFDGTFHAASPYERLLFIHAGRLDFTAFTGLPRWSRSATARIWRCWCRRRKAPSPRSPDPRSPTTPS